MQRDWTTYSWAKWRDSVGKSWENAGLSLDLASLLMTSRVLEALKADQHVSIMKKYVLVMSRDKRKMSPQNGSSLKRFGFSELLRRYGELGWYYFYRWHFAVLLRITYLFYKLQYCLISIILRCSNLTDSLSLLSSYWNLLRVFDIHISFILRYI